MVIASLKVLRHLDSLREQVIAWGHSPYSIGLFQLAVRCSASWGRVRGNLCCARASSPRPPFGARRAVGLDARPFPGGEDRIGPSQISPCARAALVQETACSAGRDEILSYDGDTCEEVELGEQYGISYADTVNLLRRSLPAAAELIVGSVVDIHPDPRGPRLSLANGLEIESSLVGAG